MRKLPGTTVETTYHQTGKKNKYASEKHHPSGNFSTAWTARAQQQGSDRYKCTSVRNNAEQVLRY